MVLLLVELDLLWFLNEREDDLNHQEEDLHHHKEEKEDLHHHKEEEGEDLYHHHPKEEGVGPIEDNNVVVNFYFNFYVYFVYVICK